MWEGGHFKARDFVARRVTNLKPLRNEGVFEGEAFAKVKQNDAVGRI